jgi:osmoprotectant transport system substrate-binding protein
MAGTGVDVRGRSRPRVAAAALLVATVLGACAPQPSTTAAPILRVAAGSDPETVLLGRTIAVLATGAGIEVELVELADPRSERQAVLVGDVDVHIGYSGQAWLEVLARPDPPGDPAASVAAVRSADLARGLVWLTPTSSGAQGPTAPPANATFALFVAGPPALDADLRTVSALALRLGERPDAALCVDPAFAARSDGLGALLAAYGVRRDRPFLAADAERAVLGVVARDCLAGLSHATDGQAWAAGLQPLADDLRFFFAMVPVPVVRAEALAAHPGLEAALAPLRDLSTAVLGRANARVVAGEPVGTAATGLVAALRAAAAERPPPG